MANEFIARKGLIALSDSQITGSLNVSSTITATNITGTNTGDQDLSSLNTFTSSIQSEVNSLTAATSSYLTELPSGVVSSSAQITITEAQISDLTHTDISSLNTFSGSIQSEVDSLTAATSSYLTSAPSSFPYTGSAIISGSLRVIGTMTGSLFLQGSGSTLFEIVGSEGQLFSVTDNLSGSLFAVSDVSGIPILEVFSDDTVKIGTFNNEAIIVNGSTAIVSGSFSGSFEGDGSGLTGVGSVDTTGTPANDQIAIFTDSNTIEGDSNLTFDGSILGVIGTVGVGTDNPTYQLHVSSSTAALGVYERAGGAALYLEGQETRGVLGTVGSHPLLIAYNSSEVARFTGTSFLVTGSLDITDQLSIPGFPDVSASLAAAVAGGDDLGNHTAITDLNMGGNDIVSVGNVDGVDVSTLKSDFDTLKGKTIISSSAQVDHDSTTNFSADEHFTQANITTVGTVTSGNVSAILPAGTVSGSSQTVANLDGQNVTVNSLTVENSSTGFQLKDSSGTSTYVNFSPQGGLYINPGGAGNSISASTDITTHGDIIGESTHIKLIGPNGGGGSFTYLSSSGDPAAGGFKLSLGDIDGVGNTTTITINDSTEQILLSKALSVTGNITVTGTVDGVDIASLETSVQANETEIASLTAATSSYLTSSPFTAAGISGSFNSVSASLAANIPTNNNQLTNGAGYTTNTGTVTSVGGTGTVSGLSLSGTVTSTGNLTLGGTISISSTNITDVDAFSQTGTYASLRAQGTTAADVGLGNVTNESKATMFTSPTFTGTVAIPGFADVSASLAAAVAGGDNLGNHTATQDLNISNNAIINVASITGSDSAAIEITSYPIGYEQLASFPITGSGLVIRETGLPANNYPMLKIGDVEMVDINSVVSPNVFLIHNVDSFLVASGSEPVNLFGDGPNKLFEHTGDDFKIYTKGIDAAKMTVTSASVLISDADLQVAGRLFNVASETTIEYIAGYTAVPNPSPTNELYVQSVSSVIANTNRIFNTGSSALASDGGALGDVVKFGGTTTTAGGLYYLNSSGGWTLAQANAGGTSTGSLAVALGTNSTTDGMLLRGFVNPFGLSDAGIGAPVYVASASAGRFSGLPSQQTGEIVRVVGHAYGTDLVYFHPSNNWIEIA